MPLLVWWAEVGFVHGAGRGSACARTFSAFLALAWWPCSRVLLLGQTLAVRRRSARYYLSRDTDAVLAVVARPDGWHVEEHMTAVPGAGRGRQLRHVVASAILTGADNHGVTIHANAASKLLAQQYNSELLGLVDVGAGLIRGRRLRRLPSAAEVGL